MNGEYLFIVPRQKFHKPLPFAVSPGFPEASGLLLVMDEQDFDSVERLNAGLVWRLWAEDMSLDEKRFDEVVDACRGAVNGVKD